MKSNRNSKYKNKILIILTSGRSGSSLISKFFECFNYNSGETLKVSYLIDKIKKSNPKGHYENIHLLGTNEYILKKNNFVWFSIHRKIKKKYLNLIDTSVEKIISNSEGNILLKDPRMSTLAQCWHEVLIKKNYEIDYLFLYRDPSEFIHSITKRDFIPFDEAEGLWLSDNHSILKFLKDKKFYSLCFNDFVNSKERCLKNIEKYLQITHDTEKFSRFKQHFYNSSYLRSSNQKFNLSSETIVLYKILKKLPLINNSFKFDSKEKLIQKQIKKISKKQNISFSFKIRKFIYFIKSFLRPLYSNHRFFL